MEDMDKVGEAGMGKNPIVSDMYRGGVVNPRREGIPMKGKKGKGKGGGTKNQYGASRIIC